MTNPQLKKFKKMTVAQLEVECQRRGLRTNRPGAKSILMERLESDLALKQASTKRNHAAAAVKQQNEDLIKRMKMSVESSLKEYVCVISRELPLEPMMGPDGQIYERCEIEAWIQKQKSEGRVVTSPVTNQIMGETLIPAQRIYNAIENLIQENSMDCGKLLKFNTKF